MRSCNMFCENAAGAQLDTLSSLSADNVDTLVCLQNWMKNIHWSCRLAE